MAQVQPAKGPAVILEHDPYVVLDPRFAGAPVAGGRIERLWTGGTWCEGPAWLAPGHLVWSDIPSNRLLRWDEATGSLPSRSSPVILPLQATIGSAPSAIGRQ